MGALRRAGGFVCAAVGTEAAAADGPAAVVAVNDFTGGRRGRRVIISQRPLRAPVKFRVVADRKKFALAALRRRHRADDRRCSSARRLRQGPALPRAGEPAYVGWDGVTGPRADPS